ncbi:hypothetical protein V8E53_013384 [Lactarius tabidus]
MLGIIIQWEVWLIVLQLDFPPPALCCSFTEWFKHPVFDALGPALGLLMGGPNSIPGVNLATLCMFWRAKVMCTGATAKVANKTYDFAVKMCTEVFTLVYAQQAEGSCLCKCACKAKSDPKGKGKAWVKAMDRDKVIDLDTDSSADNAEAEAD